MHNLSKVTEELAELGFEPRSSITSKSNMLFLPHGITVYTAAGKQTNYLNFLWTTEGPP